jgi:hypothetical protein
MKIKAFWDAALCSLLGADRRFRGAYCLQKALVFILAAVRT